MQRVFILLTIGQLTLNACAQFPDLDISFDDGSADAIVPTLIPIDPLLLTAASQTNDAEEQVVILVARVAQLRARARAMQRPVIDRASRRTLTSALRRHNQ